jgi:hypothetical protein
MYYLEDDTLKYSDILNISIYKLALQRNPFISDRDIKTYTVIYIDDNPKKSYQIVLKDSTTGVFAQNIRPFVFVLNGFRFCIGEYWPSFMSYFPRGVLLYKAYGKKFHLDPVGDYANTKFKDPRIIETLIIAGVQIEYKNIGGS